MSCPDAASVGRCTLVHWFTMLPFDAISALPASSDLTVHRVPSDTDPLVVARAAHGTGHVTYVASARTEITALGSAWTAPTGAGGDRFHRADAELAELRLDPAARLVVGFSFDPDGSPGDEWSGFPPLLVELPEIAVVRDGDRREVVVALRPGVSGAYTVTGHAIPGHSKTATTLTLTIDETGYDTGVDGCVFAVD